MTEVHFIHTSDWHLGFYQYNKPQRFGDYFAAVKRIIEKIIEIKPQFVLHTGDIFHHPRPSPAAIRQVITLLKMLRQASIPIYVIRGNHDGKDSIYLRRGGGILSLLKDLKLVNYVNDTVMPVPGTSVKILGVGYYPGKGVVSKIDEILSEHTDILDGTVYSILAFHAFVEGQVENASVSLKSISDIGVDYIGAGHYHIPWVDQKKHVFAPGSSETTAISDANRGDIIDQVSLYSSFFEIKSSFDGKSWGEPEYITHQIPVRPKILIYHETTLQRVEDIRHELEDLIEEKIDVILLNEPSVADLLPILMINLKTQMGFEQNSEIRIEDWFVDDFLHIISSVDGELNVSEISTTLGASHHIEDVISELIEIHSLDEKYGSIVFDLLTHYGDTPPGRDLSEDVANGITDLLLQREPKQEDEGTGLEIFEEEV